MLAKSLRFFTFTILFFNYTLHCQNSISGIVINHQNEALPFVNILINNSPSNGVISDIDGKFQINFEEDLNALTFSYIGYETLTLTNQDIDNQTFIRVKLKSLAYEFEEIVIKAGENPAHRIIRKVIENRDRYNPKKMDGYSCTVYNKTILDWLPNEEGIAEMGEKVDSSQFIKNRQLQNIKKFKAANELRHAYVMEAVTQRHFSPPENYSDSIILNRVAGFQNPKFVGFVNGVQPFSFYDEVLTIIDKDFINPIHKGTFKRYFFNIEDTLFQQKDTVFIISFHPRKQANVEGLEGFLYINTDGYALQNVIAHPPDTKYIKLKIEQQYQKIAPGIWFPEQLNFELEAPKYPHKNMGIGISGKSYISNVLIHSNFNKKTFSGNEAFVLTEKANKKQDSLWTPYRLNDLTLKELRTYQHLDSLGTEKKFDNKVKWIEALYSGRYPIGKLDILLHRILAINDFEGIRLGFGMATSDTLSRFFSLGAHASYGFKDQSLKYGAFLNLKLLPKEKLNWLFEYQRDIYEPAALRFPLQSGILTQRFYANRMDSVEIYSSTLQGKLFKFGQIQINLNYQKLNPQYNYAYLNNEAQLLSEFEFPELQFHFRYAFGERYSEFLGAKVIYPTKYPILQFGYAKGLKTTSLGGFDYQKIIASLRYDVVQKSIGETSFRIETGLAKGDLPFPKLFSSSGLGSDFQLFILDNSFQTMDLYEFLSDRFVHFFFRHDFGARLFKTEKFKPEISIVHSLAYGSLKQKENHQNIEFNTLEKGFFEGGLILSKLINLNYLNLLEIGFGVGVYYRYGAYAFPDKKDNLAWRMDVQFGF